MKKVTYQQIADALQTSRVTVWKALNNKPGIAPSTKEAIIMKAIEMGYPVSLSHSHSLEEETRMPASPAIPDSPLCSFISPSRSPVNVAVVVSRPETSTFWMTIIHYQAMTFSQSGINLIYTYLPPTYNESVSLPDCLTDGTVCGIIVMNIYDAKLIEVLNSLPIEKIFLDCPSQFEFSSLNGDLFLLEGISNVDEITERIIQKGKKRIHFIGDIAYAQTNRERYLGYQRAMQRHNLSWQELPNLTAPIGIESYKDTIDTYLSSMNPLPEAIICASDYIAWLVILWLKNHGYSVPKDILVSGYDDNQEFKSLIPLTTVHVNTDQIGIRLASQLIERLRRPETDYEYVYIRSKTVFRLSTGDIANRR